MICPKCGAQNADGSQFCQNCGEVFAAQAQQFPGQQPMMGQQPMGQQPMYSAPVYGQPAKANSNKTKMIIIISACAAVIAAVLIVLFVVILPNTGLKGKVRHKWTLTQDGMTATYDFKNSTVDFMGLGIPIPFEWKVVGDDRISITVSALGTSETQEFVVSFSSDGKTMTMTDPTGSAAPTQYTRAD